MNFSQSPTFAESDANFKTFWNPCFRSQNGDFYKKTCTWNYFYQQQKYKKLYFTEMSQLTPNQL